MIHFHPDDNILSEYATGTLDRGIAIAVKTHLMMCPACRKRVSELNLIGAAFITEAASNQDAELKTLSASSIAGEPESTANEASFSALMAKIKTHEQQHSAPKSTTQLGSEPSVQSQAERQLRSPYKIDGLPELVQKLIRNEGKLKWQFLSPSLKQARLRSGQNKYEVCLHKIRKGGKVASHDHRGTEITVILDGAFSDENGTYRKGDFLLREPGQKHRPTATQDQDCLCLSVVAAPVKISGFLGKLLNPFMRIHPA